MNLLVTFCISCCPSWKFSVEQNIAIFPVILVIYANEVVINGKEMLVA